MATETEQIIFIKQMALAEDLSLGTTTETQVRNGVTLTGEQINAKHLLYLNLENVNDPWNGRTVTDILSALIVSTGITPTA